MKNASSEIPRSRICEKRTEHTLLRRIASEPLPCVLTGDENLLAVSKLFQAGYVDAVVRLVLDPLGGVPQIGVVVSEITPLGCLLLRGTQP
ncbi:hypothetical protein [Variovorax soli]|uniref:Uncharacterized protein n=1 Tax=Variovorax soli TaxID=376815 RepID=A0ABU1N8S5_9BURK|nr:hypothetical protein [Variovorax soli]MDR6534476.1 hypothetical protein [Variovorax soli]